jgi:hypothetical protein
LPHVRGRQERLPLAAIFFTAKSGKPRVNTITRNLCHDETHMMEVIDAIQAAARAGAPWKRIARHREDM